MVEILTVVTNSSFSTSPPHPCPPPHQSDLRQLELVLSLFRTDWCDTAFQTTLLLSVCAILLGCLLAFNKWPTGLWVLVRASVNNTTPVEEDQIYCWSRTAVRPMLTRKISGFAYHLHLSVAAVIPADEQKNLMILRLVSFFLQK